MISSKGKEKKHKWHHKGEKCKFSKDPAKIAKKALKKA